MISVVIPTCGSSPNLASCLKSLAKQSRKPGETIVVFDSKDDTNIKMAKGYGVKVLFDSFHSIGGAYYTGSSAAKGGIVAFTDDDCILPPDWLDKIEKEFSEDIDVVSGEDIIPDDSSAFQKAAYQTDKSRTMSGPVYGKKARDRLRAANIAYRKKVFVKENFNPKLDGLQEPEFHYRLFSKGFKMKFDPKLYVYHRRRNSPRMIFSQIYRNGKAKIDLIKMHRGMTSLYDVTPFVYITFSLIIAYLSISGHLSPWIYIWVAVNAVYFLGKPFVIVCKTKNFRYYPHLVLIVFVREVAYGLGIISGLGRIFTK